MAVKYLLFVYYLTQLADQQTLCFVNLCKIYSVKYKFDLLFIL